MKIIWILLFIISIINAKDLTKVNITNTDARNAVMALNHMHASLNKIILYNDKIVLEEEYNDIINNINLTVINDREIVNVITYLMDTLTTFKLTEMEKEQFQREYEEKLDNAITSALSGISVSGVTPQQMAISLVISTGSAYMSYKNEQKSAQKGLDKNKWKLKKDTISELNEIRKDFLITYWKIMKRYNMPDKWRITEEQFTRFVTILKDNNINKKYRQLIRMKTELNVFPTYWYELSLIAHRLHNKDSELDALAHYESLNDTLLRHNDHYSLMLANKISYLDYKKDLKKIIKILQKIYTINPLNAQRKLFIAMKYQQMGYTQKAEELLNENIDDNFLPTLSQRLKANMYLSDNKNKDYEDTINTLLDNQNLSASEYLYYLGKKPLPQLVKKIQKEVNNIKIIFKKTLFGKDDLFVWLPKKWVFQDIKDTELQVEINNIVHKFTDISKKDKFLIYHYKDIVDKKDILNKKIHKISLKLVHKTMPLTINYNIKINKKVQKKDISNKSTNYWDKAKNFATTGVASELIKKSKEKYNEYTQSFEFIEDSIIMQDKCFDLKNSLKPCK